MKLILIAAAMLCLPANALAKAPNIVFILADDQSWSGTSVPMIPGKDFSKSQQFRTPNVERLASQGMTFSQAYAAHCKCECSRAAIQMGRTTTSLNAPDKGSRNWSAPVSDSLVNTLKRANPAYRAAHFGKWQWFHTPQSMGYDVSDGITMNQDGDSRDPEDPKQSFGITRRATAFMETQVKEGHPFYLQLSYYAVHSQPQALASTLKKYEGQGGGGGRGDRAVMAAMTEDFDTCIGVVLKKLEDLRIADNTLVIYMSDNGGRTEVLAGGKGNLGEGGLRVPLIVRAPGIKGGAYSNDPVISYDIFATVLDFAAPGFVLPKGTEGGSWKPVMSGNAGKVKRPIDRFVFHQAVEVEHPQSAIRKGDFKLLYYWNTRDGMLFDLTKDLGEERNIAKEKPEVAAQLQKELKDHIRAGFGEQVFAAMESGKFEQRGRPGGGGGGKPRAGKRRPPPAP
ncbi:MAG: sulfatase-like hydrolase/transferase [Chthoniobacteraceae bacterium]